MGRTSDWPVTGDATTQAMVFEAAVMFLYVTARRARVGGKVTLGFAEPTVREPVPEPLVCFEAAAPAHRFKEALSTRVGDAVWIDVRTSGIRHRYQVHGVCTYDDLRPAVLGLLAESWRYGTRLLNDPAVSPSSERARRRHEHAVAAWRALMVAGTQVRRSDAVCVRVPNSEFAALLVRAARLLQVDVRTGQDVRHPVLRIVDHSGINRVIAASPTLKVAS